MSEQPNPGYSAPAGTVFWPHLIIGLVEIGASLVTKTYPQAESWAARRW